MAFNFSLGWVPRLGEEVRVTTPLDHPAGDSKLPLKALRRPALVKEFVSD